MQEVRHDGTEGELQPFNQKVMEARLEDPNVKYMKIVRLKAGMRITVPETGQVFKVTAARPNGKITMREEGK